VPAKTGNSSVCGSVALVFGKGHLQFHLHCVHEDRGLMADFFFLDTLSPKPLGELCHFGAPETVCLFAMKTLKSVGASSYVGGPPVGGELQQCHAISILDGPNRPYMKALSPPDLHKK
jgi:hypothetical protein